MTALIQRRIRRRRARRAYESIVDMERFERTRAALDRAVGRADTSDV